MKKTTRPWATFAVLSLGVLTMLGGCKKDEPAETEILLTVASSSDAVDSVELYVRNINYDEDSILIDVTDRSILLGDDPIVLRLKPSFIADVGPDGFLVHAKGYLDNELVMAKGRVLNFVASQATELELIMDSAGVDCDADVDGFESCTCGDTPTCDCADQNASKNVFTVENCDDEIDNNCTGYPPNEGCPCDEGDEIVCTTLAESLWEFAGIGACTLGTLTCGSDGRLSTQCTGAGEPSAEVCNDIDDDCDGTVDEGCPCTPGNSRACHRGFVDALGCTPGESCTASDLAQGDCSTGIQACEDGEWARSCAGDQLPQRAPGAVGWIELPEQCDGRDNDCDGLYDEEPDHDADADGYTYCGRCNAGTPPPGSQAWLCAEDIDCNDSNDRVNPGALELCYPADENGDFDPDNGEVIDEDCRCDTGINAGLPYNTLAGGTNCSTFRANLDCRESDRHESMPAGICSDNVGLTDTYFAGFYRDGVINNISGDCLECDREYGLTCNTQTGGCSTKDEDCGGGCDVPGTVAATRPICCVPIIGSCNGVTEAEWDCSGVGVDPSLDCPPYVCGIGDGGGPFYDGVVDASSDGLDNPFCYFKANTAGDCDTGACIPKSDECLAAGQGDPVPRVANDVCKKPNVATCTSTTAPVYDVNAALGSDPYNECPGSCDGTGRCAALQGQGCGGADPACEPGLTCVDGVCCNQACDGVCEACLSTLTGSPDGTCAAISSQTTDASPTSLCAAADGCSGSDCVCEPGTSACKLDNGEVCSGVDVCASGICECADTTCSVRRCAALDCAFCEFNAGGTAVVCGALNDGVDDGTCGALTCNGSRACNLDNNSACTTDAQCETNFCECSNAACSARRCSEINCGSCDFNSNGDSTCEGSINDGADDVDNSCGSLSCNGTGDCHLATGEDCSTDNECETNQCECDTPTCAGFRTCSAVNCATCRYTNNDGASCVGDIADGSNPGNVCGSETCNGAGACHLPVGETCTADEDCESNACECATAECAPGERTCSATPCNTCEYNTNEMNGCDGDINNGIDPNDGCAGALTCNGNGACHLDVGIGCASDQACESGNCECDTADCSGFGSCSISACGPCEYTDDGGATCSGNITDGETGGSSCGAGLTCAGTGSCHVPVGDSCASDSDCETDNCQCANGTCSAQVCADAPLDCGPCETTSDGVTCDGDVSDGENPGSACGATACDGSGACYLAQGEDCTASGQCLSGACECDNANCAAPGTCSAVSCAPCRFTNDGGDSCGGNVADGTNPDGICGAETCNGAGACYKPVGGVCSADAECSSDNCQCGDTTCGTGVCSTGALDCTPCTASSDGTSCDLLIEDGENPNAACGGALTCNGSGGCHMPVGGDCTDDDDCETNACECDTTDCTGQGTCSAAPCAVCQYTDDGGLNCDGVIDLGVNPNGDCGGSSCDGAGSCQ